MGFSKLLESNYLTLASQNLLDGNLEFRYAQNQAFQLIQVLELKINITRQQAFQRLLDENLPNRFFSVNDPRE